MKSRQLPTILSFSVGVLGFYAPHVRGQVLEIPDSPSRCDGCRIDIARRTSLGTLEGPGYIGLTVTLPRDSRGRYYVSSGAFIGEVKMYDSAGAYVGHLARRGYGPGEVVSAPRMVVSADDSVYLFDDGRLSVFGPGGTFQRTVPLGFAIYYAVPSAEGFVVAGTLPSTRDFSATVHTIDRNGSVIRSFARETGNVSVAHKYVLDRQIGPGVDGTVWSATTFGSYTLQQWRPDGTLVATVTRDPGWFDPKGRYAFSAWRPGSTKPPPVFRAVSQDSTGLLWVVVSVADAEWENSDGRASSDRLFDSIIEVLDLERKRVLASIRLDQFIIGFVGPDLFSYGEGDDGVPEVVVWRARLVRN